MACEAQRSASRERVFTRRLVLFLAAVGIACAVGFFARLQSRSWPDPVLALADGDLDGEERKVMLDKVMRQADADAGPRDQWAALLAAVASSDRQACTVLLKRLGGAERGVPQILPPADQREFLHLGDPTLANVARAWWAEAAREPEQARARWAQVAAQCRFAPCPLAEELAAAALERLR